MSIDHLVARLAARRAGAPLPQPVAAGSNRLHRALTVLKTPCPHLGESLGRAGCGGAKLHRCDLHGCTVSTGGPCADAKRVCAECSDYPWTKPAASRSVPRSSSGPLPKFTWVSAAQLVSDAALLAGSLPTNCAGVVGVPRSGMIPASVIATQLHLPLYTLGKDGPVSVGAGSRGGSLLRGDGPLAVVDDTVYGGRAMDRARRAMGGRSAVYCAVYVRPEAAHAVDLFARELPSPHLLSWNLFNNGPFVGRAANNWYGGGVAVDLDGVIVHDRESGGLVNSPYLVPRAHPVKLIVTGRSEKTRTVTEEMLRSLGVSWGRLEMLPEGVPLTVETAAAHKAKHYGASACGLYVESCPEQAERIFKLTRKPVACPIQSKVYTSHTSTT